MVADDIKGIVFDEADGEGSETGGVAVITKFSDGDEGFDGDTRESLT